MIEALERAGLAALNPVERRPELGFGLRSNVVAGRAQTTKNLLTGSGILCQRGPARTCEKHASNHPYPHHSLLLSQISLLRSVPRPEGRRLEKSTLIKTQVGSSRLAIASPRRRMTSIACTVNVPKGQWLRLP